MLSILAIVCALDIPGGRHTKKARILKKSLAQMDESVSATHTIVCSHCGQHILVEDSLVGMSANCPTCDGEISIPSKFPPPFPKDVGLKSAKETECRGPLFDQNASGKDVPIARRSTLGYFISIVVRLVWSLTLGVFIFFPIGLILFLLLDIFMPEKDIGYRTLVNTYKWGSCHWFKGVRFQMETDDYNVRVEKERQKRP